MSTATAHTVHEVYTSSVGTNAKIVGIERDGKVTFYADCDEYPNYVIKVEVTPEQARELASQPRLRLIQDILPTHPREIRELFLSGKSPAMWDRLFRGGRWPVQKPEKYPCYFRQD